VRKLGCARDPFSGIAGCVIAISHLKLYFCRVPACLPVQFAEAFLFFFAYSFSWDGEFSPSLLFCLLSYAKVCCSFYKSKVSYFWFSPGCGLLFIVDPSCLSTPLTSPCSTSLIFLFHIHEGAAKCGVSLICPSRISISSQTLNENGH
jgi:hypothetical protein